ncbi:hypothetical protein ACLM5J_08635 [Nocardioides sp. Bht2]|uniref:hypothetical protein n=1 Tax=Nocardioides sp. Bht2 TaxID=3392297 RepID=UPI0039B5282E
MRLTTIAALAVGFVLGARAGRERYEQIHQLAIRSAKQLEEYGSGGPLAQRLREGAERLGDTAAGPRPDSR